MDCKDIVKYCFKCFKIQSFPVTLITWCGWCRLNTWVATQLMYFFVCCNSTANPLDVGIWRFFFPQSTFNSCFCTILWSDQIIKKSGHQKNQPDRHITDTASTSCLCKTTGLHCVCMYVLHVVCLFNRLPPIEKILKTICFCLQTDVCKQMSINCHSHVCVCVCVCILLLHISAMLWIQKRTNLMKSISLVFKIQLISEQIILHYTSLCLFKDWTDNIYKRLWTEM